MPEFHISRDKKYKIEAIQGIAVYGNKAES